MILAVATGGVCLALSYVLSLIKIYEMPQGGSVTPASMLPILFFCLCFGVKKGFCVTFAYSLLQLINGYFMHPAQVILDYTLAFTILGVAGFFAASEKKRLQTANPIRRLKLVPFWRIGSAVFLAFLLRFISHVLSGVIFYAEYAGDQNPWVYSILYNGSFLLVEAAITTVILIGVSVCLGLLKVNISSK
ncbi:MAG: energy-coupled thiamine transporter ThiT [Clostridiales bacterium]|nr:energy-coupled thiamine transporter ThiT [Clostridiales bacterium]